MKQISEKLFAIAFLAASVSTVVAQSASPVLYGFKIMADMQSGSNGVNQAMMNRFLFGGYIPREKMLQADKYLHGNNRAGIYASYGATVLFDSSNHSGKAISHPRLYKIGLELSEQAGATFDQGAFRTVFLGNADFKGQTLSLKSNIKEYRTTTVWLGWNLKKKGSSLKFGLGFSDMMSYQNIQVKNGSIRTDSSASNVYAAWNGDIYSTPLKQFNPGVVTEISWQKKNSKKSVYFSGMGISNFGIYMVKSAWHYTQKMDSMAHIKQAELSFKSLTNSAWASQNADTFSKALTPDSSKEKLTVWSPYRLFADFQLGKIKLGFNYIHIPGYIPAATIAPSKPLKLGALNVTPSLQLGGFDTYNINVSAGGLAGMAGEWKIDWLVKVYGVEGFVAPGMTHGGGVMLGVKIYNDARNH